MDAYGWHPTSIRKEYSSKLYSKGVRPSLKVRTFLAYQVHGEHRVSAFIS